MVLPPPALPPYHREAPAPPKPPVAFCIREALPPPPEGYEAWARTLRFPLFWQQREFVRALESEEYDQVAYGGSRAGGKSHACRVAMVMRRLQFPGSIGGIFRQTIKAVVDNHRTQIEELLDNYKISYDYNVKERIFTLANRSQIHLCYASSEAHISLAQGIEFMDMAFDEATQFKERVFQLLTGSNRPGRDFPNGRPKVWLTCNPGGIGHGWVKREFVKNKTNPRRLFIKSRLYDNVVQMKRDPGYADRLVAGLPDYKRAQWLDGDWDVMEGQYFTLLDEFSDYGPTVRELDVPYWARWFGGFDWGYWPSAFAGVYAARWRDTQGRDHLHFSKEIKQHRLDLDEQAEEALGIEAMLPMPVRIRYADPATEKKRETERDEAGPTIAMTWSKNGLHTVPAMSRARIPGWMLLRYLINHGILTIDPSCIALIDEFTDAVFECEGEEILSDDIDPRCEDHLLDAARYLTISTFGLEYLRRPLPKKRLAA